MIQLRATGLGLAKLWSMMKYICTFDASGDEVVHLLHHSQRLLEYDTVHSKLRTVTPFPLCNPSEFDTENLSNCCFKIYFCIFFDSSFPPNLDLMASQIFLHIAYELLQDDSFLSFSQALIPLVSPKLNRSLQPAKVNPTVYESCIKQFWETAKAKTVNGELQIQALVDKKKVIITEKSVRSDLMLEDAKGIECLPNDVIFEQVTLMGAKTIAWNDFSSTMASAIILFLDKQVEGMSKHEGIYVTPSHTKKIFANMKREGKGFSGRITLLFQTMMVQAPEDMGKDSAAPTDSHSTPIVLDLEEAKTAQAKEIASLKKRFKQLEKRKKSRTLGLKRLRKVGSASRVESSNDVSLGAQEDASKQGKKIADLDADAEVTLIDETQERYDEEMSFDVQDDLQGEEVVAEKEVAEKEVSAADLVTTAGEVVTIVSATTTIDELSLAQTLMVIKAAKPKAITTSTTTITTALASTRPKEKGIIALDEELALRLHDEEQAELEKKELHKKKLAEQQLLKNWIAFKLFNILSSNYFRFSLETALAWLMLRRLSNGFIISKLVGVC
ncbi:hypothetical protein Tco_1273940 [Tanacetum coccineum]